MARDVMDDGDLGREQGRLDKGVSRSETLRTLELLDRRPPPAPAVVLDGGGAADRPASASHMGAADLGATVVTQRTTSPLRKLLPAHEWSQKA